MLFNHLQLGLRSEYARASESSSSLRLVTSTTNPGKKQETKQLIVTQLIVTHSYFSQQK